MKKYQANPCISNKPFVKRVRAENFIIPIGCSKSERDKLYKEIQRFKLNNPRISVRVSDIDAEIFHKSKPTLSGICQLRQPEQQKPYNPEPIIEFCKKLGIKPEMMKL
jgi:hypothetical protein